MPLLQLKMEVKLFASLKKLNKLLISVLINMSKGSMTEIKPLYQDKPMKPLTVEVKFFTSL